MTFPHIATKISTLASLQRQPLPVLSLETQIFFLKNEALAEAPLKSAPNNSFLKHSANFYGGCFGMANIFSVVSKFCAYQFLLKLHILQFPIKLIVWYARINLKVSLKCQKRSDIRLLNFYLLSKLLVCQNMHFIARMVISPQSCGRIVEEH